MEAQTSPSNILERFNRWIQESIMVKLFSIGFLMLVLLIPSSWVQDLIDERQQRADDVLQEVAGKWSGPQAVSGPILVVPYLKQEVIETDKVVKEVRETVDNAFFLPETLAINSNLHPERLQRGIFDAIVYNASIDVQSAFGALDFRSLNIPDDKIMWDKAYFIFGINDLRGIADNPVFTVDGKTLVAEPSNNIGVTTLTAAELKKLNQYDVAVTSAPSGRGIVAKMDLQQGTALPKQVSLKLRLKGSSRLDFVPAGKTTDVKLSSSWTDPSFDGEFLPSPRVVSDKGFTANWKVLHYNRPFAQQWTGKGETLAGANFGVKLLLPVDQYQKSMRSSKYGALVVLLTFVAMFLVEITQKIRIHPFQYILIGAALIIYYTLLLSFAEHVGYNVAYIIASVLTVALTSLYSITFLKYRKLVLLFTAVLSITYTFIFVIILQQDYALLLGSLGLFMVISMLMYFSRNVSWYREATA